MEIRHGGENSATKVAARKIDFAFGFDGLVSTRLRVTGLRESQLLRNSQIARHFLRIHTSFRPQAPASLLIIEYGLQQMHSSKVGLKCLGYINFGVGNLPQKKI